MVLPEFRLSFTCHFLFKSAVISMDKIPQSCAIFLTKANTICGHTSKLGEWEKGYVSQIVRFVTSGVVE